MTEIPAEYFEPEAVAPTKKADVAGPMTDELQAIMGDLVLGEETDA